jgi:hypothetical protein
MTRALSWSLWAAMVGCGSSSLVGSLAHGRTPTTELLTGIAAVALVLGVLVDRRRMAGAR